MKLIKYQLLPLTPVGPFLQLSTYSAEAMDNFKEESGQPSFFSPVLIRSQVRSLIAQWCIGQP